MNWVNAWDEQSNNAAAKNEAFCIRKILGNIKQTNQKKYRTPIFLIMLGHMQKINHLWAQMKTDPKCQLGRFCPEPLNNYCKHGWEHTKMQWNLQDKVECRLKLNEQDHCCKWLVK